MKTFLRFEKLTTELFVRCVFLLVAMGLVFVGLYRFLYRVWPMQDELGELLWLPCGVQEVSDFALALGVLVVQLLILRICCELTLLLFRALRKYTE